MEYYVKLTIQHTWLPYVLLIRMNPLSWFHTMDGRYVYYNLQVKKRRIFDIVDFDFHFDFDFDIVDIVDIGLILIL